MAQGSKQEYTDKQKRRAEHIEESYKKRGKSAKEAKRRAWATVNKAEGGGKKKGGSGRGSKDDRSASQKGGKKGGKKSGKKSGGNKKSNSGS